MEYDVIYADPPWRYAFSAPNRKVENHYPTMSLEEICSLDVPAAKDAVLYLWATAPKLREGLQVMESWGFEYKSHAVWDKQKVGMGFWFRGQHELLLVGTKGKFSPPPQSQRVSSVLREPRGLHSRKPNAIRDMIAGWFPNARRLEMFGRPDSGSLLASNDWHYFGNELQESLEIA